MGRSAKALQAGELNFRESRFVELYVLRGNASLAYREAGYAPKSADANASSMLRRPYIKEAVAAERERVKQVLAFSREEYLGILHGIATCSLDDFQEVKPGDKESFRALGFKRFGLQKLRRSAKGEIEYSLHEKKAALDELAEIFGHKKVADDRSPSEDTADRIIRFAEESKSTK